MFKFLFRNVVEYKDLSVLFRWSKIENKIFDSNNKKSY